VIECNNNERQILYKYRSLKNFKRFIEILVSNNLHASTYENMNDYMEGHYLYQCNDDIKKIIVEMKKEKRKLRICSLSKDPKNDLMLAHYADNGYGIIIGVEPCLRRNETKEDINYNGIQKIKLDDVTKINKSAKKILTCKTESWEYEKEVRIFSEHPYLKINIKEIIFGPRICRKNKKLIEDLVVKIGLKIKLIDYKL